MYCKYCGKPVEETAAYCSRCGKQLKTDAVEIKDTGDIPVESRLKPKFSLFEFCLAKILGFTLILSAGAVIGSSFLSGNHLSNAMQPPFLLIPIVFLFGLWVVASNSYHLVSTVGLTFFFLIIYFISNPLVGGFFWSAKLMVSLYQDNNQRLSSLITYSGSLIAIVTCCYLTTIGILSQRNFYSRSKKRGLISVGILIGFLFLFAVLPFARKINAGSVSSTGVGGLSPGDIFINASTAMEGITRAIHINYDGSSHRWAYEFNIENKRADGKETVIDKIISNRGDVPLNEKTIKVQGAVLKNNQITIPLNMPVVLTIYSPEPFYSLRIHTDKLEVDFLFVN